MDIYYQLLWLCAYALWFMACFAALHIAHFRLLHPRAVLKACVLDIGLSLCLGVAILAAMTIPSDHIFPAFAAAIIAALNALLYSVLGPTMADRSLSVFLLVLLERNEAGLPIQTMIERTSGDNLTRKRIGEYRDTGAVTIENDIVKLTPRGRRIAQLFLRMLNLLRLRWNF